MSIVNQPFRIWSIPHTGTRFVSSFFRYQGRAPSLTHAGLFVPDIALVIPKRHPHLCYESHVVQDNFDLARFIGWWHELIYRAKTAFVFPIEQKSEAVERAACDFAGINYIPGFPWVRVGAASRDRNLKASEVVRHDLQFAVDWFNGND